MSKHKVECKCCGMMMVPKTIFSRGIYGGWGWRVGGGKPISSCCPFCLAENWDDPEAQAQMSVFQKSVLLLLLVMLVCGSYFVLESHASSLDSWASIDMFVQWSFVGFGILCYKLFNRHK